MSEKEAPAFGSTVLPAAQQASLRRAKRLQVVGLAYLATCVVVVYLAMGSSQAMKVAWIEDLLSLIPPIAFLVACRQVARPPSVDHPYGHHRCVAIGHLWAAVALLAMGAFLVVDSASGLLAGEHPPIGSERIFGHTIWAGWIMIAAMVYTGVGPVVLGRLKMPLSRDLHDKILYADADMNKADWMSATATILGVLGIGYGLWWADSAAAIAVSMSILRDGVAQVRAASQELTDTEARTYDDADPHPLLDEVLHVARDKPWASHVGLRMRDQGHVFHTEVFVVPVGEVSVAECAALAQEIRALDWKLDNVVVAPVRSLPPGVRTRPRGLEPED